MRMRIEIGSRFRVNVAHPDLDGSVLSQIICIACIISDSL